MRSRGVIELSGLEIYAYHGCYAEEQTVGNRFIVDAELGADTELAADTDDVRNALNYVEVCEVIAAVMGRKHHLLESLVADIVDELHCRFDSRGLKDGWVRVRKMAPPVGMKMDSVGVKMYI